MTTPAAELLAWLIETAAAGTAALLLVLLLRLPVRALFGVRVAYALWSLLPLALLAVSLPAPVRDALLPVSVLGAPYLLAGTVAVGGAQAIDPAFRAPAWPLWCWLCGAIACAALFAHRQRRFVSALGATMPGGDGILRAQVPDLGPAVVGAWTPRIVLPADFDARYPGHAGELVLAHERAHLARGDTRVNLVVVALRCAYWFNPLLHWSAARLRHDQELACDAAVLARHPHSRRAYADAMLKTQLAVPGLPVGCHWQSSQSLKERIRMLKRPLPGRARLRVGTLAVAVLALGSSYAAWALQAMPERRVSSLPDSVTGTTLAYVELLGTAGLDSIDISSDAFETFPDGVLRHHVRRSGPVRVRISDEDPLLLVAHASGSANAPELSWQLSRQGQPVDEGRTTLTSTAPATLTIGGARHGAATTARLAFRAAADMTLQPVGSGADPATVPAAAMPATDIVTSTPAPPYPREALANKQGGRVLLHLLVALDGSVKDVRVVESEPQGVFDAVSMEAVKQWKLQPPVQDGKPVQGWVKVPITFSPNDGPGASAPVREPGAA